MKKRTLVQVMAAIILAGSVGAFGAESHIKQNVVPLVAQADRTLPRAPKDWKVELVAKPPRLHWPSVVEVAPDGRVFVGEDPMDMPGPGNVPNDRILCVFPDGHITVFADHLYAVFGLRYVDGKLYIHQSPKFTVMTDNDGIGTNPIDIWNSDCLRPWGAGNLNDHIPSNLRLGMDNYFYFSTGDKGMYHVKSNVDGRTIDLKGGGVARIHPDGTGLEVYSTGTRNHLDLAINDQDEIFTYDNTDDGLGWWTRFTHMVDGGYYGYPYDYRPPDSEPLALAEFRKHSDKPWKPYTLWRIDEFGGGAPTGAVCYNEDALPPEFHGNPFMCEWGKGALERFVVQRDPGTATYKIDERDAWLAGANIRPVSVAVTPDGMGFYVTDWEEGGWNRPDEKGRLFKLTYTGPSHAAPKPDWYIPAAQGKPFKATLDQLIAGLSHPAESVRLVAQRRIAEKGQQAIEPLIALLNNPSAPIYARWHAIWTLDRIDGGTSARSAILAIAGDDKADLSLREQAVRQLGTRRAADAVQTCIKLLDDNAAPLRFRAATALGRIGSEAAVPALLAHLTEKDFFTHFSIFTALHRIGTENPQAWPAILRGLASNQPAVREGTLFAIRETYQKPLADALSAFLSDASNSPESRAAAVEALAPLHRQRPAWNGSWWGTQPERTAQPGKTVEWEGTPVVLAAIHHALNDGNAVVRRSAIDALDVAPDPKIAPTLVKMFGRESDAAVRKSLLKALAASKAPEAMGVVVSILKEPAQNAALVPDAIGVAENVGNDQASDALVGLVRSSHATPDQLTLALSALSEMPHRSTMAVISQQLKNPDAQVAGAAAAALGKMGGEAAVNDLTPALQDSRTDVRKAAVTALGATRDRAAVPVLLKAYKEPALKNEAIAALTHEPDVRAVDAYLEGLGGHDAALRVECRRALTPIRDEAWATIEAKLDAGATFTPAALSELKRLYSTAQPIRSWAVVGPFSEGTPDPIHPESIADASLSSLPSHLHGAGDKPVEWRKMNSRGATGGFVNLEQAFDPHEHVYAYAVAEITSKDDRDADFTMGSDDGLILWLNGQPIFKDLNNHSWSADMFRAVGHLKAGRNVLVAKITQDGGPWGFSVAATVDRKEKLYRTNTQSQDPATYAAYVGNHSGDASKGSEIFHNASGVGCIKCHRVNNEGGQVGPDLSDVAAKYNRDQIVESVLFPSKQIESGYEQTTIRTRDGNTQSGVVRGETDTDVTLYDSAANRIVIRKADITGRRTSSVSVMPEGLQAGLTHQQFADLIAYLQTLKSTPAPAATSRH